MIVGYIPGAPLLEIASHDPRQGVIFYDAEAGRRHAGVRSIRSLPQLSPHREQLDVPGLAGSQHVYRLRKAGPMPQLGSFVVDHRNPLDQRWGGFYVSGAHGARVTWEPMVTDMSHRGGDRPRHLNWTSRSARDRRYPAPSDIVALMVFDHQGHAINLLTRLGWETRYREG